jgi:hypothetical protein
MGFQTIGVEIEAIATARRFGNVRDVWDEGAIHIYQMSALEEERPPMDAHEMLLARKAKLAKGRSTLPGTKRAAFVTKVEDGLEQAAEHLDYIRTEDELRRANQAKSPVERLNGRRMVQIVEGSAEVYLPEGATLTTKALVDMPDTIILKVQSRGVENVIETIDDGVNVNAGLRELINSNSEKFVDRPPTVLDTKKNRRPPRSLALTYADYDKVFEPDKPIDY